MNDKKGSFYITVLCAAILIGVFFVPISPEAAAKADEVHYRVEAFVERWFGVEY